MSNDFKTTLATISLLVAIPVSVFAGFGFMLTLGWSGSCSGSDCYAAFLLLVLGLIVIVLYFAFLKTRKDLFFLPMVGLLIVIILILIFPFITR
ncbi:MAG: hypothetical protein UW27_C0002G0074 [Parcubacteria group bacterium GW2011_GWA1_44_13]|uniref:Transmembrane protein n=1 Tax=Candidatus Nomurabacteria bacterium GW2011_GWB1_44_12 TaxID=1618748 RepID=A0A837IDZ7_9BACT|nr:MAG: hypothetical protein UW17_C0007G0014 [Candidatus Nomurabacteria bacterium GW2011_GWD1_44_10]KKT37129.1 MAG: hypothetical protein UW25_C0002G0075 [Candidatus Nomurabacteria bacterium GW2011_GWB1_44_12]KKT38424.1 MAG: hypothetical protein UW27_C0002G0074 [Parcubacteria group bacterium GW2011_GWA1_44_13]KKT60748.1 MAG: hypothetical protein UW54_C0004G0010 [Parcubacteria group bacterium GW2011_GWC1_44_26]HBB44148.1 hypothetical protein [Candidatus Yonathbacteria bacterium]